MQWLWMLPRIRKWSKLRILSQKLRRPRRPESFLSLNMSLIIAFNHLPCIFSVVCGIIFLDNFCNAHGGCGPHKYVHNVLAFRAPRSVSTGGSHLPIAAAAPLNNLCNLSCVSDPDSNARTNHPLQRGESESNECDP